MDRVLVGYATRSGSTAEVARIIADRLRLGQAEVTLADLGSDPDPSGYALVVLGSAVHGGGWLPEGLAWLEKHRALLGQVALFNVSMSGADPAKQSIALGYNKAAAGIVGEGPQAAFGGRYHPKSAPGLWGVVLRFLRGKSVDALDPAAIQAWADTLADTAPEESEGRLRG